MNLLLLTMQIGGGGPFSCPLLSADVRTLYLFMCRYVKNSIYTYVGDITTHHKKLVYCDQGHWISRAGVD